MKVGFILESGPDGAEEKILKRLIPKITSDLELREPFVHNDGKHEMIAECGKQASLLLEECDRVIILCDLGSERHRCKWQEAMAKDIEQIRTVLQASNVDVDNVRLLIVQEEIETWFVAEHRAVAAFLSEYKTHKCTLNKVKHPQTILNPKKQLTSMFQGWIKRYWDIEHADGIAKHIDPQNLQHICSFVRLQRLIAEPSFACTRVQEVE